MSQICEVISPDSIIFTFNFSFVAFLELFCLSVCISIAILVPGSPLYL